MRHKSTLFPILIIGFVFLLTGCQPKSQTSTKIQATPQALADKSPGSSTNPSSPLIEPSATAQTLVKTQIADADKMNEAFQKNFKVAQEDANKSLQNKAKFCAAMVKYPSHELTLYGDQYFFFYADELSKDYYWIVSFDALKNNQKKRMFAARKDFNDEIKCYSTPPTEPKNYVDAYQYLLDNGKVPTSASSQVASMSITTWDNQWVVAMLGFQGQNIVTELFDTSIKPQASSSASSPANSIAPQSSATSSVTIK